MIQVIKRPRLGILVSGTGTILEKLIAEDLVDFALADRVCPAIDIARERGIPVELVLREDFTFMKRFARGAYTRSVVDVLHRYHISLVAMAGFMTVFSEPMFEVGAYPGLLLNTHPALLPAFPGNNAVQEALDYGVRVTGCTIHIATLKVDAGPILAQEPVRVLPGHTKETLHEDIKNVERVLYPQVIRKALEALAAGHTVLTAFP